MSIVNLHDIERLIDQLDLPDKVRLMQHLAPQVVGQTRVQETAESARVAWSRFRTLGEKLAATSVPGAASLTGAVSGMRR